MTPGALQKISHTKAAGYMLKPFEIVNLADKIEETLSKEK
jgi:hypothetical protein